MTDQRTRMGMHGIDAVVHLLDRKGASYELITHPDTFAAIKEAEVVGDAAARMAKTVLLHDHGGFRTAVIPASERLDLHKARRLLADHHAFCSGGDHGHTLKVSPREIERLGEPLVGDIWPGPQGPLGEAKGSYTPT